MKFNALIPELSVSNLQQSKDFYLNILGFKLEYERVADHFAFLSLGEAQLMIEQINGHWDTGKLAYPLGRGINFQIAVEDVSVLADKLKVNHITLFRELTVNHYECQGEVVVEKEILVQDPDGYLLRFSETSES
ncbi:MAG: bleomycin resistance protein [Turicibacter sp.]